MKVRYLCEKGTYKTTSTYRYMSSNNLLFPVIKNLMHVILIFLLSDNMAFIWKINGITSSYHNPPEA